MILGIIRGADKSNIHEVISAAIAGGINQLEITLNTPDALELIKIASKSREVGAGTVLNVKEAVAAVAAGARFIVSPLTDLETIKYCKKNKIPVYPGALTPTEIWRAWEVGADMVKVFPIKLFGGPDYVRELKAPFNEIKILACGGVSPQNIKEYFEAGAAAVAVGNSVFNRDLMEKRNFKLIEQKARELVQALSR